MKQVSLFDSFLKKQKPMQAPTSSTPSENKKDEIKTAEKQAPIDSGDVDNPAKIKDLNLITKE